MTYVAAPLANLNPRLSLGSGLRTTLIEGKEITLIIESA